MTEPRMFEPDFGAIPVPSTSVLNGNDLTESGGDASGDISELRSNNPTWRGAIDRLMRAAMLQPENTFGWLRLLVVPRCQFDNGPQRLLSAPRGPARLVALSGPAQVRGWNGLPYRLDAGHIYRVHHDLVVKPLLAGADCVRGLVLGAGD